MGTMLKGTSTTAPCQEACPAGIDVPRYIRHTGAGRFAEALDVIRERIPFPSVCGYACVHPCEAKCARLQFDEALAIRMLKKVAAELGAHQPRLVRRPPTGKRVAVIGSGPCGLTAAYTLHGQGHQVTVYEALPLAGGMLRYGIPAYRLPREIVDREIAWICDSGVELITGTAVASAASLREKGYDAVLVATGAWKPVKMGIPGEETPGVMDGLAFLHQVNEGRAPAIGGKVVVVGGGNTAIDAARSSVRLGAEAVLLYRRSRAEMPAGDEDIVQALDEGVRIEYLTSPVTIAPGRVTCIRMQLADPDATGRRAPVPVPGSEWTLPFDTLMMAVGQQADASSLQLEADQSGRVRVDPGSLATPQRGIFAGGDAVSGPSTIIEAIAQGRRACVSIDRFLGGTGVLAEPLSAESSAEPPEPAPRGTTRPALRTIALKRRTTTFDPVERAYGRKTAVAEASRCLSCDLRDFDVLINDLLCKDCGYCREVCSLGIFDQSADFNPSGYRPAVVVHRDRCVGCLRCLYICPDFAIAIQNRSAGK